MNAKLSEAKKHFIESHPLGKLTIVELKQKAEREGIFVYGDKASVLQCFNQSAQMCKLFRINS